MQLSCRQTQCLGDAQRGFERQRSIQFRNRLAKLYEGFRGGHALFDAGRDLDDAGAGMLPVRAGAAPPQGEEHRVGGNGRVPHKRGFLAGIEETQANIVVGAVRREHEGDFGVRELACHGEQSGIALAVRVEHDDRRIAGEACGCK